jgi:hypothetical protein
VCLVLMALLLVGFGRRLGGFGSSLGLPCLVGLSTEALWHADADADADALLMVCRACRMFLLR